MLRVASWDALKAAWWVVPTAEMLAETMVDQTVDQWADNWACPTVGWSVAWSDDLSAVRLAVMWAVHLVDLSAGK